MLKSTGGNADWVSMARSAAYRSAADCVALKVCESTRTEPTCTTTFCTVSVPGAMLARTSMTPATAAGFTGALMLALTVMDWMDTVAGMFVTDDTTTDAQPFLLASAVDVAQIATPGVGATAVATPAAVTDTFEASLDDHVTVVAAPLLTSTAAVNAAV